MLLKLFCICLLLVIISRIVYVIITFFVPKEDILKINKEHKLVKCVKCSTYIQEQDADKKDNSFSCKEHSDGGGGN